MTYGMFGPYSGWILFAIIGIASWVVQSVFQSRFKRYSQEPLSAHKTGADIARKMLADNGIIDVRVVSVEGDLTDHYNPATKTVNLSRNVYFGNSVAAAAVAAHECGHAIQHAASYAPLKLRSSLVPAVSFSSKWMSWILLAGMFLLNVTTAPMVIGVVLYGVTTIFSFITLPVEINASQRAIAWLDQSGIVEGQRRSMATSALRSAAYTYVIAALGSLATLVYYVMMILDRRD